MMLKESTSVTLQSEQDRICRRIILEFLLYAFFLIITTCVVLLPRSFYMYYFYNTIETIFLKRTFYGKNDIDIQFSEITSVQDWWEFVKTVLLHEIYQRTMEDISNTSSVHESILLGPPRLRQIIIKNGTCEVHEDFQKHFHDCFGSYSFGDIETEANTGSTYFKSSEINNINTWGKLHNYDGGGYVEDLSYDQAENEKILTRLKTDRWIQRGTRLIVFEFTLYNANVNLFCLAKFLAEMPPVGGLIPSFDVRTYRFMELWTPLDYLFIACYIIFIGLIIYFTVEEVIDIRDLRWKYVTRVWNWIDLTVIVIGYTSVILTIFRVVYMYKILSKFNEHPEEYLSLEKVALAQFIYNNMMGICAFLVWIKLFKYLSFWKVMTQFSTTLNRCAKDLLAFGVMFTIAFVAFAQLGHLLFGDEVESFRNFGESVFTMMRALIGDFDYAAVKQANRFLGPLFFLMFILFVFFILLNMFLAIINDTYSAVKSEVTDDSIHLGPYIKRKMAKVCKWCCCGRDICKFGKSAEADREIENAPPPQPTSDPVSVPVPVPDNKTADAPLREMSSREKRLIDKYFEVVDSRRSSVDIAQLDSMNQRISRLEELMDYLVDQIDALVTRLDDARPQENKKNRERKQSEK